ncbi:hypothetical protein D3C81_2112720 [compost metagenome]
MPTISAVNLPLPRRRVQTKRPVPNATQAAPVTPAAVFNAPCGAMKYAITPSSRASPAHGASIANRREAWSRCQLTSGPNGSSATSGAISTTNSVPK